MSKNLLIHNNNVLNIKGYDQSIEFTTIKNSLTMIKERNPEIVYIKDSLTQNYMEFVGLLLAYHIRLTNELEHTRFVTIVIISDLDGFTLNKITPQAQILFTKNTFLNNLPSKYIKLNSDNFKHDFLDKTIIEQPKDMSGDHDISNQWSIYRWAEFLNVNSESTYENKSRVENILYFKYLKSKYRINETYQDIQESKIIKPVNKKSGLKIVSKVTKKEQKVLYIDDQWNNGWKDIFANFFQTKLNNEFKVIEEINKNTTFIELKKLVINYIFSYRPDLIILDLRILQEDFLKEKKDSDISGVKLLRYIKEELNPGIQIILLTASGKSTILNEANKYNILGYIKKEHPHDISINTRETFEQLKQLIDIGLTKIYLKDIWELQHDTLSLPIINKKEYNKIKIEIESIFEILNSDMKNRFIYAIFAIFKVLEIIIEFYITESKYSGKIIAFWKNTESKVPYVTSDNFIKKTTNSDSNSRTENKIRVILHERLNLKDRVLHDKISSLVEFRNHTIHPGKKEIVLNEDKIITWFNMMNIILREINKR